jgi:hypothetical protein
MSSSTTRIPVVHAEDVIVNEDALAVECPDGRSISVPLAWYPRLVHGKPGERSNWRLVGPGVGIHWPALDEDTSVENLLAGQGAKHLGKASGRSRSGCLSAHHLMKK